MRDEKEFFCECIRQHEKSMYALAFSILKNENDAADIMQEAILKAYCNMDNLRDKRKFKSWILSIVHNTAIEFLRFVNSLIVFILLDISFDANPTPGV